MRLEDVSSSVLRLKQTPVRYILRAQNLECNGNLAPFCDYLKEEYDPIWTFSDGDTIHQRR